MQNTNLFLQLDTAPAEDKETTLPPEILLMIFIFLPWRDLHCSMLVCTRWAQVSLVIIPIALVKIILVTLDYCRHRLG